MSNLFRESKSEYLGDLAPADVPETFMRNLFAALKLPLFSVPPTFQTWMLDKMATAGYAIPSSQVVGGTEPVDLPFAANWGNYGGGFQTAEYWKDISGVVHLRGLVKKSGTPTTSDVIGTLPAGFRPPATLIFAVATGEGAAFGRVDVAAAGTLTWIAGSSGETDYTSLSGITFSTST